MAKLNIQLNVVILNIQLDVQSYKIRYTIKSTTSDYIPNLCLTWSSLVNNDY